MLVSCSENHLHLLSRVDDFEFSLFFHKLLFLCCKDNLLFPYSETICVYFMQPVVSFGRVFFGLWNRFFLSALPGSPRPPCTMQKYPFAVPQGRVFARCKAAERTARGNGTTYRFFLLPYGVMAENQSFNNRLANDLLIDIKTNLLYYRMIVL